MVFHHIELFLAEHPVFTHDLHDFECVSVRKALADQEVHDIVTAGYDLIDRRCAVSQKILSVVGPYIRSMRES